MKLCGLIHWSCHGVLVRGRVYSTGREPLTPRGRDSEAERDREEGARTGKGETEGGRKAAALRVEGLGQGPGVSSRDSLQSCLCGDGSAWASSELLAHLQGLQTQVGGHIIRTHVSGRMCLFWTLRLSPSSAAASPPHRPILGPVTLQELWHAREGQWILSLRAVHGAGT